MANGYMDEIKTKSAGEAIQMHVSE